MGQGFTVLMTADDPRFWSSVPAQLTDLTKELVNMGYQVCNCSVGDTGFWFVRVGFKNNDDPTLAKFNKLVEDAQVRGVKFIISTNDTPARMPDGTVLETHRYINFTRDDREQNIQNTVDWLRTYNG